MTVFLSPAKVNLFLRITGRREDGYHELISLVQTLSLFDTLTFKRAERDSFFCSNASLPLDGTNLVSRALALFRKRSGWNDPLEITLDKKIPTEAGLGGGSSNAATTLFALNQLIDYPFSEEELQEMGAELGSDISVFFSSGTALMKGRGEIVEDRKDLFPKGALFSLFKPSFGLSTPLVYQKFREVGKMIPQESLGTIKEHFYMNDLEHPAFLIRPELQQLKHQLEDCGYDEVVMSGSGSALFCLGNGVPPAFDGFRMVFLQPIQRNSKKEWYK